MKNGKCPKCSENTVYMSKTGITYHTGGAMYVQNLKSFLIMPLKDYDVYVCTSCGYYETYITDDGKLKEIASKWNKI